MFIKTICLLVRENKKNNLEWSRLFGLVAKIYNENRQSMKN